MTVLPLQTPYRPVVFSRLSLQMRLAVLVIVSVLPLLLFVLGQQYRAYQEERALAGRRALDIARSITLAVERNVQTQIAILEVLAGSISLHLGDLDGFRQRVEQVVAEQLPGSNVLLFEKSGQQVMNLNLPSGAALPVRQTLDSLNKVFATGRPAVSDMFFGIVMRRPVVSIEVPVKGPNGDVRYSLAINPPLTSFAEIIRQRQLPDDWVASVFDGNGVIIARTPNADQFIGQKASASFLPSLLGSREGIVVSKSLEGVPLLSAFTHAADFSWSVGIGVPEASLVQPALDSALRTLAVGGALLLTGLALAHRVARTVTGPIMAMRRLVTLEEAAGAPPPTGLREVDDVVQAFHAALERRRHSEQQVQTLTAELVHTSRLSAMGQLSSSIAHELNQPLTAVMNYTEAARHAMDAGASPRASELLGKAAVQAERAGQIMRRLRSLVEKGPAERTTESLSRVVEEASALASTGARLDGIEVVFDLARDLPPIEIDKIQIQQVVVNLVRNAVEVLRHAPQRRLIVRTAAATAGRQEVSVIDTGPGIAPEIAAQLFQPFVTTKKDGMGIGLSISRSIVEAHGGRLWAEANPGGGTILRFTVSEGMTGDEP